MERIAVLFPSADPEATTVRPDYAAELAACEATEPFFPVLYNEDAMLDGAPLVVSEDAPTKTCNCVRRGVVLLDYRGAKDLAHAMKRHGYRECLQHLERPYWGYDDVERCDDFGMRDGVAPETLHPRHRFRVAGTGEERWDTSVWDYRKFGRCLVKTRRGGVLRDADGEPLVVEGLESGEQADALIRLASGEDLDAYTGTYKSAPAWFEQFIPIAKRDGVPVEWRDFYLAGRLLYRSPKFPADGVALPEPPEDLVAKFRDRGHFQAVDCAMDEDGRWWVLRSVPGEEARVPEGGSPEAFYRAMAEGLDWGPPVPASCRCVVADVVQEHPIGKDKVMVPGSRHFAAGTAVVFADAFWGMGGDRCTVVGVPKYSEHPTAVSMWTELLENFRVEEVTDPEVLRALFAGKLQERFERPRDTSPRLGWWLEEEEKKGTLEEFAESMNEHTARLRAYRAPKDGLR